MAGKNSGKISQTVQFDAAPEEVFELLMDGKKHAAFSGSPARISRKAGGSFSAYDDYATGKNIEIVPGKKIVQEWRASDWEEGVFSIATFVISKSGSGAKLVFTQTGVPEGSVDEISEGWREFYWGPMKKMLAGKKH